MADDFHEAFLKANANLDFIASQFADVLRNLMRALAAHDPSAATYRAAEQMNFVVQLLSRTDEKFGFFALFGRTVEFMNDKRETPDVEGAIIEAAKSGVRFLVERSCDDNAATARSSRRRDEFLNAVRYIDEAREDARARRKRQ
jgi:hypothetical protein